MTTRHLLSLITSLNLITAMTFQDFIGRFPEARRGNGVNVMVRCPAHEDGTASLSVGPGKNGILLKCFASCTAPQICSALGITVKDLFYSTAKKDFTPKYKKPAKAKSTVKPTIEKLYSYTDTFGREVYQAVRLQPKDFRQRHRVGDKWVWNMDGVERVLYNLPAVTKASRVWVVEGEKDCDSLAQHGVVATTNVGGAGKWLDPYSAILKGKEVVLCGDNDEAGRKHIEEVFESVSEVAKNVRLITLPSSVKDISDHIVTFNGTAGKVLEEMVNNCVPHYGGVKMPLYTMADIEPYYAKMVQASDKVKLDLGNWLPSFRTRLRPMVPGNVLLFVADTKIGKTAILQNLAFFARDMKVLICEMELTKEEMFERCLAMGSRIKCSDIEANYKKDARIGKDFLDKLFANIMICPEPRLSPDRLEQITAKSELVFGEKPAMVLIDYVQLMKGKGGSRYEQATSIGESLKELAVCMNTIVVATSQVARPEKDDKAFRPGLHSAKDSGSYESSASTVIGVSRGGPDDPNLMELNVLASTKGGAGTIVRCNFDGATMTINERANVNEPN
jgi:5S rRNA maturation endonuclease (ribonuclease M5)